jgi:hypothetical protein
MADAVVGVVALATQAVTKQMLTSEDALLKLLAALA